MKLVFMGTPEFACATLECLSGHNHEILAVVTGLDKPTGRRRRLSPTPIAVEAEQKGLKVIKAGSLKSESLYQQLKELDADLFVVAAFRILPPKLFNLPKLGSINIHTSLLPKYQGAAPINWAIINGEKETGLTSFFLNEQVDRGDIILQEKTSITPTDTYDTLHQRLAEMVEPFLEKTLNLIASGNIELTTQDQSLATPAPKLKAVDAMIDFGMPADRVAAFVRGMATRPGAYSYFRGEKIKFHFCKTSDETIEQETRPGSIIMHRRKFLIACGKQDDMQTAVEILKVVPAGKKEMDGQSFKNGFRPKEGELFGEIPQGVQEKN